MGKNPGKRFEEDFVKSIPERCDVTRLKDAGGWAKSAELRFTIKNPCDFVVFSPAETEMGAGQMYKLELKSTAQKSLPFANIKDHQLESLVKSQKKHVNAWFIVNFRAVNETYVIAAHQVQNFVNKAERKSIPLKWFRDNCQLIKQTLIKVRWRYDLEWL